MNEEKLKRHNIFLILYDIFTLAVWAWLSADFISKGAIQVSLSVSSIYLLILAYYVGDKELRRVRRKYFSHYRHGEYFVFLWGLTLLGIVGFYVWGGKELGYHIPKELPTVAGSVLILYFITEFLKESASKRKNPKVE